VALFCVIGEINVDTLSSVLYKQINGTAQPRHKRGRWLVVETSLAVKMSDELKKAVFDAAKATGMSSSSFIRMVLIEKVGEK
jgi:predicted DNA binding CopG/RHH family protein